MSEEIQQETITCKKCKEEFIPILIKLNTLSKNCEECRKKICGYVKQCLVEDCKTSPSFNFPQEKKPIYCKKHSKDGMVNIKSKKCIEEDCLNRAIYTENGEGKAVVYCHIHKKEVSKSVRNINCLKDDCNKRRLYNFPNEKLAIYCEEHHIEGMIKMNKVRRNLCKFPDCEKTGSFRLKDETGLYCVKHKTEDMISKNRSFKKCIITDCNQKADFNKPSLKAMYCKDHCDEETMINVRKTYCKEEGCFKFPNFNLPGNKSGIYCVAHKKENMIDVKNKKCIEPDCPKKAICNYEGKTPGLYCTKHCLDGMIDVHNPRCLTEGCMQFAYMSKYCARCFYWNFPDHQKSKHIKLKENEVVKFIKLDFEDLNIIYDKQIIGDKLCINVRPDALIHLNEHSIIVEIDEHAHRRYDSQCEISRTHRIHEALDRNVIFIRFNPDNYIDKNKKQIPSCFVIDRAIGLTTIRKPQQKNWEHRLEILKQAIQKAIDNPPELPIEEVFLFYDGFDGNVQKSKLTESEQ
jgi:hypothetical protein